MLSGRRADHTHTKQRCDVRVALDGRRDAQLPQHHLATPHVLLGLAAGIKGLGDLEGKPRLASHLKDL